MTTLSFQNVEKMIFYDKKVRDLFPELSPVFNKWMLGVRAGISSVIKDALLNFINEITPDQIEKLEHYWGTPVIIQKVSSNLSKSFVVSITEAEELLNNMNDGSWYLAVTRKKDLLYISCWR